MDRFLLAENPIVEREDPPLYIFHTQRPPMLIQVHHEAVAFNDDSRLSFVGNYENSDGNIETISFSVEALLICETEVSGEMRERVNKILNKAWHWYVAYLNWQDEQIDTDHDH